MPKTKKDLEKELAAIGVQLKQLTKDFDDIKKRAKKMQKQLLAKKDNKKILKIKNEIKYL